MVDTSKVHDRRTLRFSSVNDALADIDRIVAAERAGTLRRTGNWTAGQIFGHVSTWINYGYEGFPFQTPWFVRLILRTRKNKYLRDGLPAGVRIPKVAEGTYGTAVLSLDDGTDRLRKSLARLLSSETARFDSPAWGPMPHDQRIAINLRHSELHLGFLHP